MKGASGIVVEDDLHGAVQLAEADRQQAQVVVRRVDVLQRRTRVQRARQALELVLAHDEAAELLHGAPHAAAVRKLHEVVLREIQLVHLDPAQRQRDARQAQARHREADGHAAGVVSAAAARATDITRRPHGRRRAQHARLPTAAFPPAPAPASRE